MVWKVLGKWAAAIRKLNARKFSATKYLRHEIFLHEKSEQSVVAVRLLALLEMLIRRYFQPENGLPDPKGSLSCSLPSQAIALANKEVVKVIGRTKKCGVQRTEYRSTTLWGPSCTAKPLQDKDSVNNYDGHEYTIPFHESIRMY